MYASVRALTFCMAATLLWLCFSISSCYNSEFHNCTTPEFPDKNPDCIENKVNDFKKLELCEGASVDVYELEGSEIFVFNIGGCCCDIPSLVYDRYCVEIGFLGGIQGNTMINGADFFDAVLVKTIWKKE